MMFLQILGSTMLGIILILLVAGTEKAMQYLYAKAQESYVAAISFFLCFLLCIAVGCFIFTGILEIWGVPVSI
jgi:hypothetical protein